MAPGPYLAGQRRLRALPPGGSTAAPALAARRCRAGPHSEAGEGGSEVRPAQREAAAAHGGAEPSLAMGERLERGAAGGPGRTGSVAGAAMPPPLAGGLGKRSVTAGGRAGPGRAGAVRGRGSRTWPLSGLGRFCPALCRAAAGMPAGLKGGSGRGAVLCTKRPCGV
ncbi:uncharacterized protein J5F26_011258 [Ciconia maguari]